MKHKLLTASAALPLSVLLAWGSVFSMVTGLNLPVDDPVRLVLMWCFCALAGCILFSLPSGSLLAVSGVLILGFWLWDTWGITVPFQALITRLSTIYDLAYGWGVLEFTGLDWQTTSLDLLLGSWGSLVALAAAAALIRGRGSVPAVLLALPPLISTMVVTDTAPDALPLLGLLAAGALILIPASVARQSPVQGARLAVIAALPTALVLGGLFLLFPKDSYVNRADEQLSAIVSWWRNATVSPFQGGGGLGQNLTPTPTASASTRLSSLGPRRVVSYPVMDVTAGFDGVLYLRGQDYDVYDGISWTSSRERTEALPASPFANHRGTVTIATRNPVSFRYVPSYLSQDLTLTEGHWDNPGRETEYTWSVSKIPSSDLSSSASAPDLTAYLELPLSTLEWAEPYAQAILENAGLGTAASRAVEAITGHVSNTARYSLNTARMDGSYDDFALWFLEESDTGYCVHFATAATVLLRAAGIPARYVTGYMTTCREGQAVTVTSEEAHAWVEYYDEDLQAWIVAEPTPPDLEADEPETESVTPPPPVTQPTAPTEPEDSTAPSQSPAPSDGTQTGTDVNTARIRQILRRFVLVLILWLAVLVQRLVRLALRRRTVIGSPNRRALVLWRDVERVCAVLKQEPPAELLELAQKARFSQHKLTKEELHRFSEWLSLARTELGKRPLPIRLWCRYVLALW